MGYVFAICSVGISRDNMIHLLRLINRSAIELDNKSIEFSLKLLDELDVSMKEITPKNVFTFTDPNNSGIKLASPAEVKGDFVFFGWVFVEAFNPEMCLWNLAGRSEVSSLLLVGRRLVYNVETAKAQAHAVQSEELSLNTWYFLELYHLVKSSKSIVKVVKQI